MPDKQSKPITKKEETKENPDNKIDEDFKGFPHGTSTEEAIKPSTRNKQDNSDGEQKDGEKQNIDPDDRKSFDEQDSDGSAGAFDDK